MQPCCRPTGPAVLVGGEGARDRDAIRLGLLCVREVSATRQNHWHLVKTKRDGRDSDWQHAGPFAQAALGEDPAALLP